MRDQNRPANGGGNGCILVPIAAITVIVGVVLWAGFGWQPQEAALWGLGVAGALCGLPLLIVALVGGFFVVGCLLALLVGTYGE